LLKGFFQKNPISPLALKLLITAFTFHPERNGVAEVASRHAFGLAARGHEVTVVTSPTEARSAEAYPQNLRVVTFSVSGSADCRVGFSGEVDAYREFVATFPCDAILMHCWHSWATDTLFPVLDRNPARKILISHGYNKHVWEPYARFPWGIGGWLGWLPYVFRFPSQIQKIDHLVVLSAGPFWKRLFDRYAMEWLGNPRWSVIPNGASILDGEGEAAAASDFRQQFGIPAEEVLLLQVSNYNEGKNQLAALRCFAQSGLEQATLVFIGGVLNEYGRKLQAELEILQRAHPGLKVKILEKLPRASIAAAYRAADLFLLFSRGEMQPLVLIDAMACGLPFIASDTGCIAEMPGGIVVANEAELVEQMRLLATGTTLRERLGALGRKAAQEHYHWKVILDRYEALLFQLTAPPSPGALSAPSVS
jgi:glycosyltransferase involved in cell wall biosynthesis